MKNNRNQYRELDGSKTTLYALSVLYGLSEANISREFKAAGDDYVTANKVLLEKQQAKAHRLQMAKARAALKQQKLEIEKARLSKINPVDSISAKEAKALLNAIAANFEIERQHRSKENLLKLIKPTQKKDKSK